MKIYKGIFAILFLCIFGLANAQNPLWTFPEELYEFDGSGPINLPTNDYNGQEADYVHAGLQDPYGDLMFFKFDDLIFDESGTETGVFNDGSNYVSGTSETLIVPQPGSCNLFYIFQGIQRDNFSPSEFPHFSIYNDSLKFLAEDGMDPTKTSWDLVNDFPFISNWGNTNHGVTGTHFAATKEDSLGVRKIYISNNNRIYRVELDCDGLSSTSWVYDVLTTPGDLVESGWRSELELYEDTASNRIKIAHPYYLNDNVNGNVHVMIIEVDSASGNFIPGSRIDIQLGNINGPGSSGAYVHGLEFSPDGKGLYIMHEPNLTLTSPLSFYNFNTSTLSNLSCTNISNFTKSQLQINGDSANYSLYMASNTHMGRLTDPNSPDCSNWTWNSIPLSSYSINSGSYISSFIGGQKHIVPDQIDYDDYVEMFIRPSCDCCYKYAYSGEKSDTSYSAPVSATWSPGVNSNPWDAAANDTIFIRDSLVIPAGLSVTISNLNFAFGRDAVVILERGNSSTPGALVRMADSTLFTFDFRCSERGYVCEDPEDEECDRQYWQGVRVEGSATHAQSVSGFTRQSRFFMSDGSRIEYANVGILVGHENFSGHGGGIVRLDESTMKDNITGVKFDPYTRIVSSQEVATLSRIEDMSFFWTSDLPTESEPFRHIDIRDLSGLLVRAGTFDNTDFANYTQAERGIGIYSSNSALECTWYCDVTGVPVSCDPQDTRRPVFTNLHRGVEALGVNERLIEVYHGIFRNNAAGIFLSNQTNPRLLDNDFDIPPVDNNLGIFLGSCTGYQVENNFFESDPRGPRWNYGISVQSSGPAMNEIYKNTFEDITIGIINSKQNAECGNLDNGLRWRCNTFNTFIPYADIHVYDGVVSDDQGSCSGGSLGPAGNFFSHSHGLATGPYDLKVDENNQPFADCGNPALEIKYRYHNSLGTFPRLEPIVYTITINNYVQPFQCSAQYGSRTCPVQNTTVSQGGGGIGLPGGKSNGGKSNDIFSNLWSADSLSFDDLSGMIESYYVNRDELTASLDNGNTQSILDAVDMSDWEMVETLLAETGVMLSAEVVNAIMMHGPEDLKSMIIDQVFDLTGTWIELESWSNIELPSWQTENDLAALEGMEPHLWNKLIYFTQKDTLGEFTNESVLNLFQSHQPQTTGQRYFAALCERMGVEEPNWIHPSNSLNSVVEDYSLPIVDGELPRDVYNYVSEDFYNHYANMSSLNAAYVAMGASYDPSPFTFPDIELPEAPEAEGKAINLDNGGFDESITVMPNPFNDLVIFDLTVLELERSAILEIYDIVGKKIYSQVVPEDLNRIEISGSEFPVGILHYSVIVDGVQMDSGSIVRMK
jgi:hypothetical protein